MKIAFCNIKLYQVERYINIVEQLYLERYINLFLIALYIFKQLAKISINKMMNDIYKTFPLRT